MKHFLPSTLALFGAALVLALTVSASDFMLVRDSKPEAVIIWDDSDSKELEAHIQFFNEELERCTQTVLPVVRTAENDLNRIVFRLEKRPLQQMDSYTIDFPDAKTLRITGTETSVRWAFNHLLEQELGIRWLYSPMKGVYGPEINHYPQLKNASVKAEAFSDSPAVWLTREGDWHIINFSLNWNAKRRIEFVHGVALDVFPVYKYAVDGSWPQDILPIVNGKKKVLKKAKAPISKNPFLAKRGYDSDWQPCWSNPETTRIAIENILEILKNDPGKKISLEITGRFFVMFLQPGIRQTGIENFCNLSMQKYLQTSTFAPGRGGN